MAAEYALDYLEARGISGPEAVAEALHRILENMEPMVYDPPTRGLTEHEQAILREGGLRLKRTSGPDLVAEGAVRFAALVEHSLSVEEVAAHLKVTPGRVHQMISSRDLYSFRVDATAALSRSAMWEMRGPIDAGHIAEGRELGRVLWTHCSTFEKITGVQAVMSQSGAEPPLATETRSRLFSVAHNALTNAFLHARPNRVEVALGFETGGITLSVSDDGVGLPGDYAERGRGFSGMRADAGHLGGTLIVESAGGGTTITCIVPGN